VEREQNLGYWEPPHYTRPVLESLAEIHMRAGKYDKATAAYQMVLNNRPNSGFALVGIARAYKKAGNESRSAEYYRKFAAAWSAADKDLELMKEGGGK
jgi:tetratricopeptide (TPR) repeat protein